MERPPKMVRFALLAESFTPSAPIDDAKLFAERPNQVIACMNALFQKGLHVALFGERGVGKTSLAKVLPALIRDSQLPRLDAVRVDCNTNDDYRSIWRKVFRELGRAELDDSLSALAPNPDPEDVRF